MGVNQGLGLVLRLDSLEITGACLSSKEERVVLYERDVGGLVMSLEELNVGNEGVNVNGVKATKRKKSWKRKRCTANRKCSENGEVIGWCTYSRS